MKRFYELVDAAEVEGGWQVTLDGRGVRTAGGAEQILPNSQFARRLAREWEQQGEKIDPASLVMRDMADYAIDLVAKNRAAAVDKALAYGESDTLCYRADPEDALYQRQQELWEPILTHFEQRIGARFKRISGLIHRPQPKETLAALRKQLEERSVFALAAIETLASLATSLVIALEAIERDDGADALWDAAELEEQWQADKWGRDPEAEKRRESKRLGFEKAHEFARLAARSDPAS